MLLDSSYSAKLRAAATRRRISSLLRPVRQCFGRPWVMRSGCYV
ncbi:hypothetical protein I547_5556 [Mycobacterium kansasii 824]|nr:hypothetical protein I547_5556 [Mycobacterium kansasii 824]